MSPLQQAINVAKRSQCRHRMGAVIVLGNRVLAHGTNVQRNPPSVDFRNATYHAEEYVLKRAIATKGAVIYIARVNSFGMPMLAAPCSRCLEALAAAGVRKAIFTKCDGASGALIIPNERVVKKRIGFRAPPRGANKGAGRAGE
ncbi:deaminase [Streptomyces mirabilis]|uniref:deaminase n=1 Tax=Streptomyces mirabilis TaxID=68239 RepID=UPI0033C0CAD5